MLESISACFEINSFIFLMFFRTFLVNISNNLCLVTVYFYVISSIVSYDLSSSKVGGINWSYFFITTLNSLFMFCFVPSCK